MYFRACYTYAPQSVEGCVDGEADNLNQFLSKLASRWNEQLEEPEEVRVTDVRQIEKPLCPKCGEVMGNLGLIYDECFNEACELYMKDPRPFVTAP